MKSKPVIAVALLALAPLAVSADETVKSPSGPPAVILERTHRVGGIGYLFAGNVTVDDPAAPPWTELLARCLSLRQIDIQVFPGEAEL